MEILIGKLGKQPFAITDPSVSRRHATVTLNESTGEIVIRDLGSVNGTYVKRPDGTFQRITSAKVNQNTVIRIGVNQTFKISDLRLETGGFPPPPPPTPSAYDVSHLKYIYELYNHNKLEIETKTGNIMMYRIMAMSLSGVIATILTVLFEVPAWVNAIVTLAVLITALVVISVMNSNLIKRKHRNEEMYKNKYTCPKCGYFFMHKPYENIVAEGKCFNCKCKFVVKK